MQKRLSTIVISFRQSHGRKSFAPGVQYCTDSDFLVCSNSATRGFCMSCPACKSCNQSEFNAEVNIHFRGRENVDHPGVMVFPNLSVCLDCGSSSFTIQHNELSQLARRSLSAALASGCGIDSSVLRQQITPRA